MRNYITYTRVAGSFGGAELSTKLMSIGIDLNDTMIEARFFAVFA